MRTIKYCIGICLITLFVFSCAPSPENASKIHEPGNYILLGALHGFLAPFALLGKIIGLNIGLYDAGKSVISYWGGYIFAIYIYVKIIRFIWLQWMLLRNNP